MPLYKLQNLILAKKKKKPPSVSRFFSTSERGLFQTDGSNGLSHKSQQSEREKGSRWGFLMW